MKKIYLFILLAMPAFLNLNAVTVSDVYGKYTGTLTIGEDPQTGSVYILPGLANNTVSLVLPDFHFGALALGDIVALNANFRSSGMISLQNYPLYIPTLDERTTVTINTSSKLNGTTATLSLGILVPSLSATDQLPVTFSGTKETTTANFQMPNSGFEGTWNSISFSGGTGHEPAGWHSFCSGNGSLIDAAKNDQQLNESTDKRPGSAGTKSALIRSQYKNMVIVKVKANGNMTSGRINAASMTADDASGNYAYSDPSESGYNTPFTAQPDSITFWAKYIPADGNVNSSSNKARMHAAITTNARYQDPEGSTNYSNVKVAEAALNYSATSTKGWQRLSVPFTYSNTVSADNARYIMVTFTTNPTPGAGSTSESAVDQVYLDDVELIYNAALTSFVLDGEALSFSGNTASTSKPYSDSEYDYSATINGRKSVSFTGFDGANNRMAVFVLPEDFVATKKCNVYQINMAAPAPTAVDNAGNTNVAKKIILNGKVYIKRGDQWFDVLGNNVK